MFEHGDRTFDYMLNPAGKSARSWKRVSPRREPSSPGGGGAYFENFIQIFTKLSGTEVDYCGVAWTAKCPGSACFSSENERRQPSAEFVL